MYKIRKVFKFEGAHVLEDSFSKCCQEIHGHSYTVEIILKSQFLDKTDMVMDFGKIKEKISPVIDSFDHAFIVPKSLQDSFTDIIGKFKVIIFNGNPTAENMARFFFHEAKCGINNSAISVHEVIVHETQTGWASYQED